jgi:hypothetical protein
MQNLPGDDARYGLDSRVGGRGARSQSDGRDRARAGGRSPRAPGHGSAYFGNGIG